MSELERDAWPRGRRERRIVILTFGLATIGLGFGIAFAWVAIARPLPRSLLIAATVILIVALLVMLFRAAGEPLRVLASVIEAYRYGDYAIRSNREFPGAAMRELLREVNQLGDALREQRLRTMEATALLDKLVAAIDIAVLAFDGERKLRLFNVAALTLLERDATAALGASAAELGLQNLLETELPTQIVSSIGGRTGRWQVTHGTFRDEGLSQHLLIVSDLHQVLRAEERSAWRRLIRVIGHEINNSLAPIKSLADSLSHLLSKSLPPGEVREDTLPALRLIAERATSLQRFTGQYSRLKRVPTPQRVWVRIEPLLTRVAALESTHSIEVVVAQELEAYVDATLVEQALINLVRNAIEAQGDAGGRITVSGYARNATLQLAVTDEGQSIANPDNLFVPFFTTKTGGSGIGLVLSRQIAEAHGGALALRNREDKRGAVAVMDLPNAVRRTAEMRESG